MRVKVKKGRGKGSKVDDTDAVGFTLDEVDMAITTVIHNGVLREGWCKPAIWYQHVADEVDALVMIPVIECLSIPCSVLQQRLGPTYQSETVRTTS